MILPIRVCLQPAYFVLYSKREGLQEALDHSNESLDEMLFLKIYLGQKGQRILAIISAIFIIFILFIRNLLNISLLFCLGISCGIIGTSILYYRHATKYQKKITFILSFSQAPQNTLTSDALANLIVNILKFLREFDIINRGQRM